MQAVERLRGCTEAPLSWPLMARNLQRVACALLLLAILATSCSPNQSDVTQSGSSQTASNHSISAPDTATPVATSEPLATPVPTPEPAATVEPTTVPSPIPTVTPAPTPTPAPAAEAPVDKRLEPWDPLLRDLVVFAENTRGRRFPAVIDVEFIDPSELADQFVRSFPALSSLAPEHRKSIEHLDDFYRAAGLHDVEFDYFAAQRALFGEVVAYYDARRRTIVIPAESGTALTVLPVQTRAVAVHELSHALQETVGLRDRPTDFVLSRALHEGEADWMMYQYVDQLGPDDRRAWDRYFATRRGSIDSVPDIMFAEILTSYVTGGRFFDARFAADGMQGIDAIHQNERKLSSVVLVDPWAFDQGLVPNLSVVPSPRIDGPTLSELEEFWFSAPRFFQMFSTAMSTELALPGVRSILAWTSSTVWVEDDDITCFALRIESRSGRGHDLKQTLQLWVDALPSSRTVVDQDIITSAGAATFLLQGCEPPEGTVAPLADPLETLNRLALVIDAEIWAFQNGLETSTGTCIGLHYLAQLREDQDSQNARFLLNQSRDDIPASCQ